MSQADWKQAEKRQYGGRGLEANREQAALAAKREQRAKAWEERREAEEERIFREEFPPVNWNV